MTYGRLKKLTSGFLTGDNLLPEDPEVTLALLESAFLEVGTLADSLHLMTLSTDVDALRLGPTTLVESNTPTFYGIVSENLRFRNEYLIRIPDLPEDDVDELDIDHELGLPIARLIASYLSKAKGGIHRNIALRQITDYNAKVYDIMEDLRNRTLDTQLIPTNSWES